MLWRVSRRRTPIRRYLLLAFVAWTIIDVLLVRHHLHTAVRDYHAQGVLREPVRVYIASIHWNNEDVLRRFWNKGVVDLAKTFGPSNVFVSVYESGSWDDSKGALRELDEALGDLDVPRNITLDPTTHKDEIRASPPEPQPGWARTPRGRTELRRISYLSRLRNTSLQPLLDLASNGTTFDYVLFLNDVVFSVRDVLALLNTNDGDYAAACSLDFSKPPKYYDTFALRDSEGHEHAMHTWPYFRSSRSRTAMKRSRPVPVTSCWNGMVFMPAAAFTGASALTFRGVDDTLAESHVEGSECCLIHADNPESRRKGVFLNPNVRVGYHGLAYEQVHPQGPWLSSYEIWTGLWKNRLSRWFETPMFKEWRVQKLVRKWEAQQPGRKEPGLFCLINEMQVLVENGWAHV